MAWVARYEQCMIDCVILIQMTPTEYSPEKKMCRDMNTDRG